MAVLTRVSSRTCVGRAQELEALRSLLTTVLAGGSASALITGEAGIGKTRLVRELTRSEERAELLLGSCIAVGRDVLAYAPVVQVLSDLVVRHGVPAIEALAGPTGDELARLVPALGRSTAPEGTRASIGRLYAAVQSLIAGLAARRPLLLCVEDLHWSDTATLDLLGLLAHRLPPQTLLLMTARTDEPEAEHGLSRFRSQLAATGARRIELGPLSREEQALQLSGILGVPPTRLRLEQVYGRAEGNPFFAEELLALDSAEDLPGTVRDLLQARLDALPAATRRVVRAAAAAGRRVEHGVLARVIDMDGPPLDDALRPAVERHVLVTDGSGYAFRHALLQETVAGTLLPGERARLHRGLAEVLTGQPQLAVSRHGLAGRIAHHWLAAGELARGRRASYDAALEADAALAFTEALTHYERVVALPPGDDDLPVARYRVLWRAAEAAFLSGAPSRAAELITQAIACVDPEQRHHHAYLHERLGRYLWIGTEGERATVAYRRAIELLPQHPVTEWQAAIVSGHAQVLMLEGRFREARAQAEAAIAIAAQVAGGRSTEGHARNNLGVCLAHLGDVERGILQLEIAARIAEEQFHVDDIARAVVNLHWVLSDAGRFTEALQVARGGIAVLDPLGRGRGKELWCRCDAAEDLLVLGRWPEAEALLGEILAQEPHDGMDAVRLAGTRGAVALRRGRLAEARSLMETSISLGRHVVGGHLLLPFHRVLVETLREQRNPTAARSVVEAVRRRNWGEGHTAYLVPFLAAGIGTCADAAVAARSARRPDQAPAWFALAADLADEADAAVAHQAVLPPCAVALSVARAELARAAGWPDDEEWGAIAQSWKGLGDDYRRAQALLREAECHLAARRRRRAADVLAEARRTADELGAASVLAAIHLLATRAGLPSHEPTREPRFHLTGRERQVLILLARGMTDRQIGAELFISHRTVERHVSSILAKLDARTRAEATAIAHRDKVVQLDHADRDHRYEVPATARTEKVDASYRPQPPAP